MVRRVLIALALTATVVACSGGGGDAGDEGQGGASALATVRVVSQNLLHGIACPEESDGCHLPERVELFMAQLDAAGCPELVSVQESNATMVALLEEQAADVCDGAYELVGVDDPGLDREVVLTTDEVLGWQRTRLAGPLRTALWVRVAAEVGVVDFVSTHLASSSDDRPCDAATCPAPCRADDMLNACQGRQVAAFADGVAGEESVVVIAGDLNAQPGEPAIEALVDAGYRDTHLAAGNAECDPATGVECTSGRIDDALTDLTDPDSTQAERIDYVFAGGSRRCDAVDPTGLFNAGPATPTASGLVFPSDHTGVEATLECDTTDAQREAAPEATVPSTTTSTSDGGGEADPATQAAITDAFATLFGGEETDPDQKLAVLEDGDLLRPYFLETYAAQAEIAPRIRVRIDAISLTDPDHADVTYTLLLDGNAVLDHLPGSAVRVGDEWLVTRRAYCDVATQGGTEIPPPCR